MRTAPLFAVWCLLCLLAGGSGVARAAAPVAERPSWEAVATAMVRRPEFAALPLRILTGTGHAPAEMQVAPGRCVLHLHTRGHPVADQLLRQAAPDARRVWMQAIVVHELAHCWRWQGQDAALQQFAALMDTTGRDGRQPDAIEQRIREEETFADVAALAWVAKTAPAQFDAVLDAFDRLRGNVTLSAGTHDTRAALDQVRREGFRSARSPFEAARALLADTGRRAGTLP